MGVQPPDNNRRRKREEAGTLSAHPPTRLTIFGTKEEKVGILTFMLLHASLQAREGEKEGEPYHSRRSLPSLCRWREKERKKRTRELGDLMTAVSPGSARGKEGGKRKKNLVA